MATIFLPKLEEVVRSEGLEVSEYLTCSLLHFE